MVSFSCEGCGDVLTKKKLDPHRNQCWGASYTCLDCMQHFQGTSYRSHTSCISEDQKYQGKLYKEKKPKGQQHQKKDSQQDNSQALVQTKNAYVEDATERDNGAVAVVDAPPRAPSPPPAANSLGYEERAALPPVNVFDFLDTSATPTASRADLLGESRMIEDSIPPAYVENPSTDVMQYQTQDDQHYKENGYTYGEGVVYNTREQEPKDAYTTPAPKSKHSRKKSKDVENTASKSDRKRKRNSPSELDMSVIKAQQHLDVMMADAPPMLHSGLTGGLKSLLGRPEFPPSPELSGDLESPMSPMKRAKQGTSKAFLRAQKDWDIMQEKERKAEVKEKERGRDRERKDRKTSTALVKVRPKKRRDDSTRDRKQERKSRKRAYSSSASPERTMKAIDYLPEEANGALIVRPNGDLVTLKTGDEARADLFMSFINKGPDSERGMSVNKALKRYHREQSNHSRFNKADEEKELWKSLRLKKNDRGEVVLFVASGDE